MLKSLSLAILGAVLCSCSGVDIYSPLTDNPVAPAAEIVIVDERPEGRDVRRNYGGILLWLCPLLPYISGSERYFLDAVFVEAITAAVIHSGMFPDVATVGGKLHPDSRSRVFSYEGDPLQKRPASPLELRFVLKKSAHTETGTTYCLGFAAFVFYLLGAPSEYAKTSFAVELECVDRRDGTVCTAQGTCSDIRVTGLYYRSGTDCYDCIKLALKTSIYSALKQCLEPLRQKYAADP